MSVVYGTTANVAVADIQFVESTRHFRIGTSDQISKLRRSLANTLIVCPVSICKCDFLQEGLSDLNVTLCVYCYYYLAVQNVKFFP